jgi:hypothetical protein
MEATMKTIDKTPFRTQSGEIDIMGRIRATLAHGLDWYPRIQAQDAVITILGKVLSEKYTLLRNVTLVDTDIELPLVLVGPQGVFLINVTHERGVYRAKDDEWGTMRGEQFVPAAINQVKRALQLSRVLQIYLERAGLKDLIIEPILASGDPGLHIESTRPAVRAIMSDALERFAISMTQGRIVLDYDVTERILRIILNGPKKKDEPIPELAPASETPDDAPFISAQQEPGTSELIFNEEPAMFRSDQAQDTGSQEMDFRNLGGAFTDTEAGAPAVETPQRAAQPETRKRKTAAPQKKGLFGMTTRQVTILGALLLFWLCIMIVIAVIVYMNLNG